MKTIAKSYPVATFFVLAFLITGGAALLTRLMTEGVIPRTRIVLAMISNDRLVGLCDGQVTFRYRDRSDGDRSKLKTLPAEQFIGRFLTHVLPDHFVRIRHYGFLSNRNRKTKLATIRKLLGARAREPMLVQTAQQWLETVLDIDSSRCPCCGDLLSERELPAADHARPIFYPTAVQPRAPPVVTTRLISRQHRNDASIAGLPVRPRDVKVDGNEVISRSTIPPIT